MDGNTIGIGVIGWGFMGRTHALAARNLPLFYPGVIVPRLVAVASRRMESALEARRDAGFEFASDNWRDLLARDDVQAVSICTPNPLHEEMAIAALKAGKHVYIDKPLSTDAASASRIEDAARGTGLTAQLAFHLRFMPSVMRAKQLMDEGRIGNVLSFRAAYLHSGSVDPDRPAGWKSDADGAGVMLDLGSHLLDMIEYLAGEIETIQCRNRTLYTSRPAKTGGLIAEPGEDACFMLAQLKGGAVGTVEASKIATGTQDDFYVQIEGDRGALRFSLADMDAVYYFNNTAPEADLGGERGWLRIDSASAFPKPGGAYLPSKNAMSWLRAHIACYYNFIYSIQTRQPARPSIADGLRTQRVMDAAMRSHKSGAWTTIEG